jgi:hypothetical protein
VRSQEDPRLSYITTYTSYIALAWRLLYRHEIFNYYVRSTTKYVGSKADGNLGGSLKYTETTL